MSDPDDSGLPELRGNQPAVAAAESDRIVVDAGAGTGKTTTMVARIERLLREEVDPGRVLVLTFANKAAHGAVDRLTGALSGADAYDVDAYTYHSFCYHLLRDYAYAAGLSPEFELLTEDRQRAVIASIHESLSFQFVDPREADAGSLHEFVRTFRRAGVEPDEIAAALPSESTIADLDRLVRDLKAAADREFGPDSRPDLVFGSGGKRDELAAAVERLQRVVAFQAQSIDDGSFLASHVGEYLDELASMLEALAGRLARAGSRWSKVPSGLFGTWTGVHYRPLSAVQQTPIGRLEALVDLLARSHAFVEGYRRYERRLADRGAVDYHGLIRRTIDLLDGDVGTAIAERYDCVFCDEFQDTDGGQLRLIELLAAESSLFVIGDADQAIYEWRGAEPTNITDIESTFPGIEALELDLNFRSVQPILDLSNRLPGSNKTLRSDRGDAEDAVLTVSADSDTERQAEQVSAAVSSLLTGGLDDVDPHGLEEIAILVRSNWQADAIASALEDDSIPYERSGESRTDLPPGIRTLFAYFRVLVDPGDDRSLARVLQFVYRVPQRDIRTLAHADGSLVDAIEALKDESAQGDPSERIDRDAFVEPERIERAAADIRALRTARRSDSVSGLYEELRSRTRIEWTFTDRDRELLPAIESRIDAFEDAPIDTRLNPELLAYLEDERGLAGTETGRKGSVGSRTEDAVDLMTVHQAKGLDFGVVLVPFLGSRSWWPTPALQTWGGRTNWRLLRRLVDGEIEEPLFRPLGGAETAEQWRVLHVALTRARDRLVLFGNDDPSSGIDVEELDALLPPAIEWSHRGPVADAWGEITAAIEALGGETNPGIREITDAVESTRTTTRQQITWYDGRSVPPDRAIGEVRSLARKLKRGELDPTPVGESRYRAVPRPPGETGSVPRYHSHTSIEDYADCERKHYLEHVVDAFDDPPGASDRGAESELDGPLSHETDREEGGSDARAIGNLFHYVAEDAFWRGYERKPEWEAACERIARERSLEAVVPDTKRCIERYFDSEIADWERVAVEVPFSLESLADRLEVDRILGYVDAIYRTPGDEYLVVDYKTVRERRSIDESYQLLLYLLGADRRFDAPIERAGYLYVGEIGPAFQSFDRDQLLSRVDDLRSDVRGADASSFDQYTSGDHCRHCAHRSLGCAPDRFR